MKIVYTLEEVKNIISKFTSESTGDKTPPKSVKFIHRYSDGGESEVENIAEISSIEVIY